MKWLAVLVVVCLTRYSGAGVLKCSPDTKDPLCSTDIEQKEPHPQIAKDESAKPAEAECLAGSEWESNCHYCKCSDSGIAECLRENLCGDGIFVEPVRCKPNTTFQKDCNTCTCLDSGLQLCTYKECYRSTIPKKSELPFGVECSPGSKWESECNECVCSSEGHPQCQTKQCTSDENQPDKRMSCSPQSVWRNECNACWCTSEGRAMCTRMECYTPQEENVEKVTKDAEDVLKPKPNLSRKVRASNQEAPTPPKACNPGQEFRMDCNKCLCNDDGQDFSCTRIDCNAVNNHNGLVPRTRRDTSKQMSTQCVPGSVFDRDCNVCRCTTDGLHATCTMKRCNNQANEVDGDVTPVPEADPSFRCTPGEQFKRECNYCTCSADGRSVFCTLRFCDEELIQAAGI